MNRHKEESAGGTSNDNRKRRRNDDSSSGGRGLDHGGSGSRGRGQRGSGQRGRGGHGGRGSGGRSGGRFRGDSVQPGRKNNSVGRGAGRHNQSRNDNHGGRRMPRNNNNHIRHHSKPNNDNALGVTTSNVVSASSSATSSLENYNVSASSSAASSLAKYSGTNVETEMNPQNEESNKPITITLPWPNPNTHYVPIEEEDCILPALLHWGRSERGMMKDQPPFRMQKIQKLLERDRNNYGDKHHGKRNNNSHRHNGNKNASSRPPSNKVTYPTTQHISLTQSLSLRRHHLKLLNPRSSMSSLRLGNEEDIRNAAALFEVCVDTYLRSHGVKFWTEEDQRSKFERSMKGVPFHQRKQPPTPDFMMKDDHPVMLSFTSDNKKNGMNNAPADNDQSSIRHPTCIHWIEAKMFYGANTIPSGTPNAVGCILPKMKDYVSLYGTGAIVFMYGCGSQLAAQLLDLGVVALDGRGLDLDRVEKHQRRWCADSWGNILF